MYYGTVCDYQVDLLISITRYFVRKVTRNITDHSGELKLPVVEILSVFKRSEGERTQWF
jgi:hypothetical protein